MLRGPHEGMIVLLDRNFAAQALLEAITRTGTQVLVRAKEHRRLPAPAGLAQEVLALLVAYQAPHPATRR